MIMLTTVIFCLTETSNTCASIVSGILYKRLFKIAGGGCPINSLQDRLVKNSVSIRYVTNVTSGQLQIGMHLVIPSLRGESIIKLTIFGT